MLAIEAEITLPPVEDARDNNDNDRLAAGNAVELNTPTR
jgi:hypothetical protein